MMKILSFIFKALKRSEKHRYQVYRYQHISHMYFVMILYYNKLYTVFILKKVSKSLLSIYLFSEKGKIVNKPNIKKKTKT